jgi:hypothetical protein
MSLVSWLLFGFSFLLKHIYFNILICQTVDTCCIDKTSSAELSEAINSMYTWYKNAIVCYAYLSDARMFNCRTMWATEEEFKKCRWFTRGWTLQELIAPPSVRFFSQDWIFIGEKFHLSGILSNITGIDIATLIGGNVTDVSVAKRMSWASKRVTTRVEDIAYCLLGIFEVSLPLLYGEGKRAFTRLQEEIMKSSDDQSLFAWEEREENVKFNVTSRQLDVAITLVSDEDEEPQELLGRHHDSSDLENRKRGLSGFLAKSPANFENAGSIVPYRNWEISTPYSMTNQGLRIELEVVRYEEANDYIGILQCHHEDNYLGPLGVYIVPLTSAKGDQFARNLLPLKPIIVVPEHVARAELRTIYIRQDILLPSSRDYDRTNQFLIRTLPRQDYELSRVNPPGSWSSSQKILRCPEGGSLLFTCDPNDYVTQAVPLPFTVILRGGAATTPSADVQNYSCEIVDQSAEPEWKPESSIARVLSVTHPGFLEGQHSSQMVLNPWDHSDGMTAVAQISKQVFMGQSMMVVDIEIIETGFSKSIPFFVKDLATTTVEQISMEQPPLGPVVIDSKMAELKERSRRSTETIRNAANMSKMSYGNPNGDTAIDQSPMEQPSSTLDDLSTDGKPPVPRITLSEAM